MKVFCPIDFSEVSVNASKWIAEILNNISDSELHLCHFVFYKHRASMFLSLDDLFADKAREDMNELTSLLKKQYPDLYITESIYRSHPKEGTVSIVEKNGYDLVAIGTTGLNALKDMTIGSMTEYIFDHSTVPVIAVPGDAIPGQVRRIALAADDKELGKLSPVTFLRDFSKHIGAVVRLVHITEEDESPFEYDPAIDMIFKKMNVAYDNLVKDGSLSETLNNYCRDRRIDLLCMIHHKRSWIKRLLGKSVTKSELFKLDLPLLVLSDK